MLIKRPPPSRCPPFLHPQLILNFILLFYKKRKRRKKRFGDKITLLLIRCSSRESQICPPLLHPKLISNIKLLFYKSKKIGALEVVFWRQNCSTIDQMQQQRKSYLLIAFSIFPQVFFVFSTSYSRLYFAISIIIYSLGSLFSFLHLGKVLQNDIIFHFPFCIVNSLYQLFYVLFCYFYLPFSLFFFGTL